MSQLLFRTRGGAKSIALDALEKRVSKSPTSACARACDAESEGRWITTKEGNHVHLDGKGNPDKGNPKVIEKMKSRKADPAKSDAPKSKAKSKAKSNAKSDAKSDAKHDDKSDAPNVTFWSGHRPEKVTYENLFDSSAWGYFLEKGEKWEESMWNRAQKKLSKGDLKKFIDAEYFGRRLFHKLRRHTEEWLQSNKAKPMLKKFDGYMDTMRKYMKIVG